MPASQVIESSKLVSDLPITQQQALSLDTFGCRSEEAAHVVARSPVSVQQLQHRDLRALRRRMTVR